MADATIPADHPAVISREEAKAAGLHFYNDGSACPRGHVAERYTSTAHCVVCKTLPKTKIYIDKGCSVEGCEGKHASRGLCNMHYKLLRRNGGPLNRKHAAKGATMQWIEDHRNHDGDDCLIWPFAFRGKHGYGKTYFRDKDFSAHVAMCILCHGEKPGPKMVVAHQHEGLPDANGC